MDVPLPWERLLWSRRALLPPGERYVLTDFRIVRIAGRRSDELALEDIRDIEQKQSWIDRALGASTLILHSKRHRAPLVLPHVRRGAQLAALLAIASGDPELTWDPGVVRATLSWEPKTRIAGYREVLISIATFLASISLIAISLHGKTPTVTYPDDDAIYPGGVKRDLASVVQFMETDVMPWARRVLGPLKGGADRVACDTCHGATPSAREWRMPAVATLPKPDVTFSGWETYSGVMDAQMRNAIYGYVADTDNQSRAAYMREVVMPGMARLLHRQPYDFTRSYEYNRTHFAFGCYHCHRVS